MATEAAENGKKGRKHKKPNFCVGIKRHAQADVEGTNDFESIEYDHEIKSDLESYAAAEKWIKGQTHKEGAQLRIYRHYGYLRPKIVQKTIFE